LPFVFFYDYSTLLLSVGVIGPVILPALVLDCLEDGLTALGF